MSCSVELKLLDCRWGHAWALPNYATDGAAGFDLRVMSDIQLNPGEFMRVTTGLAIHLKDPGLAMIVVPRSGLGARGLVIGNLVGVIDSDYQGEIFLPLWNRTDSDRFSLDSGDRVAQALIVPVLRPVFQVVEEFSTTTKRGSGGFCSTGVL